MNFRRGIPSLAFLAIVSMMPGSGADVAPAKKLTDFTIGPVISGDTVELGKLQGRVVVMEFWGIHCPPCLASLPGLVSLDKRSKSKGLTVIGCHVQNGTDEEVLAVLKQNKVAYTVTRGGASPIPLSGIPRMFVFNGNGDLVFDGHPSNAKAESAIKKALRELGDNPEFSSDESNGPGISSKLPAMQFVVPEREWTDQKGNKITGSILRIMDETVSFRRSDGNVFTIKISHFSDEDQTVIRQAAASHTP